MYCRIRVQSQLDPSWQQRFAGLHITHEAAGTTLLEGSLPDQAALQGIVLQILRLGLALLALETGEAPDAQETDEKGACAANMQRPTIAGGHGNSTGRPKYVRREDNTIRERSG